MQSSSLILVFTAGNINDFWKKVLTAEQRPIGMNY